jgi:hypothetical protein
MRSFSLFYSVPQDFFILRKDSAKVKCRGPRPANLPVTQQAVWVSDQRTQRG